MNRTLIAGLCACAILPATALTAGAAPVSVTGTYPLSCKIGSDGESLQIRMNVRNTSGHVIRKGTPIRLTIRTRHYSYTKVSEAYRDVGVNETIPLSAPPKNAQYCTATVSLNPHLKQKLEKGPRLPR